MGTFYVGQWDAFKIQQFNLSPIYPSVAIKLLKSGGRKGGRP